MYSTPSAPLVLVVACVLLSAIAAPAVAVSGDDATSTLSQTDNTTTDVTTTFRSASISGIVTDADDTSLPETAVYARQFSWGPEIGSGDDRRVNRISIRPLDNDGDGQLGDADDVNEGTDEFDVTLQRWDAASGSFVSVQSTIVTAADLGSYDFSDFESLDLAADGGVELYTRTDDPVTASYTLDPVPAVGETDYHLRGVKLHDPFRDRSGNSRLSVTADVTVDTNVEIPVQVAPANFQVDAINGPPSAEPGEEITVDATVRNAGQAASQQTVEYRFDLDGDGVLESDEVVDSQAVDLVADGSDEVTFTYTIPSDQAADEYLHGVVTDDHQRTATVGSDDSGADDGDSTGSLTVSGSSTSAPPNGTATVQFDVTNAGTDGRVVGVNLTALPDGWTVVSQSSDGGTWADKRTAWFWTTPLEPDTSISPSLVLQVPAEADPGSYLIVAAAVSDGEQSPIVSSVSVTADTPTPVEAVAGDDGVVEFGEVIDAIQWFNEGTAVPGTDGQSLDFDDVIRIIDLFNTGNRVSADA